MTFDPQGIVNVALGNAPVLAAILWFGHYRLTAIEKKLDSFITKNEVSLMQDTADKEHTAIRREINGMRTGIHQES